MTEAEILAQFGREGWKVISRTPITEKVTTPGFGSQPATTENKPTGRDRWVLAGPNGETDEIVVRPQWTEGPEGFSPAGYEVVEPPKKAPPKPEKPSDTPAKNQTRIVEKGGYLYEEKVVDDVGTWSINPAVQPRKVEKDAQGRKIVPGENGALYEYDGQGGLLELKPGTAPEKRVSVVGNRVLTTDPVTGQTTVSYEAPAGWTLKENPDGSITAIDPQTLETRTVQAAPSTTSVLNVPSTQPTVTTQQGPGGAIGAQANPGYVAPGQKLVQDAQAAMAEIDRQVTAGALTEQDAAALKQRVNEALKAGLQGTTPAAQATQQIETARADAERASRERTADADRTSRETVSSDDRASREGVSAADREQRGRGDALNLVNSLTQAGMKAQLDSLPFMAPTGTAEDLAGIRNAFATGTRPPAATPRTMTLPFNPATLPQDTALQVAAVLAEISPAAAAALRANPDRGLSPERRIGFTAPTLPASSSTSPATMTGWNPSTNTAPYDQLTDQQKDALNAFVRAKPGPMASAPSVPPGPVPALEPSVFQQLLSGLSFVAPRIPSLPLR